MAVDPILPITANPNNEELALAPQQGYQPLQQPVRTPFTDILTDAVQTLNELSALERRTDQITLDYTQGRASLEQAIMLTNRLNTEMQLAVSVINTGAQTLKEITNMQV